MEEGWRKRRKRENAREPLIFFDNARSFSHAVLLSTLNPSLFAFFTLSPPSMAASAVTMRRSSAAFARHPAASAGNAQQRSAVIAAAPARRLRLPKSAVAAAAAGDSARGFGGGASAAPSTRAAPMSASGGSSDDGSAAANKQLAETRAALREALDELAAMSAKAEVSGVSFFRSFFLSFSFSVPAGALSHPSQSTQFDVSMSQ